MRMGERARDELTESRGGRPRLAVAGELMLVFLVFFVAGAWSVPAANEPHYLSKAKHYWDSSWCPGDFLCNSADTHVVFQWAFGWLARWMPLVQLAWCGRLLTWALLAWSWRRLSWSLIPAPLYAVLSAALLVTLVDRFDMAGEWLIGGVEAKGFAYVFVLLGLEALVRGRWTAVWLLFGAASAFHVLVGGWAVIAALFVWGTMSNRPSLVSLLPGLFGGLLLALPGLLPALRLTQGVDSEVVRQANALYVYERLYHHLLPQRFPPLAIVRHLGLIAVFVLLAPRAAGDDRWRRLTSFVAAAVGIAACGMWIALTVAVAPDFAATWLRFYWFRMSDVMVPLGVSLAACRILWRAQQADRPWFAWALAAVLAVALGHMGQLASLRHRDPRPPADSATSDLVAWRAICDWAALETPSDAVFLTPRNSQTFRWYSGRGEVVTRKDIPQDAAGIVEWWRRLQRLHLADIDTPNVHWRDSLAELDADQLLELGREFGAQYVITTADPPLPLVQVGPRTSSYAVYRLTPTTPAKDNAPRRSP
jgi:hypothetical protein